MSMSEVKGPDDLGRMWRDAILDSIVDGYFETDLEGNITFFNYSMCRITQVLRQDMVGLGFRQILDEKSAQQTYQSARELFEAGRSVKSLEAVVIRKNNCSDKEKKKNQNIFI